MKKHFIIVNFLVSFISLLLFLLCLSTILVGLNKKGINQEIKNYLNLATSYYDGENEEATYTLVKNLDSEIRLTFIDKDGIVFYDNIKISTENHLTRPEIENLGNVYYRHSETLLTDYVYVAGISHDVYIRVAIVRNTSFGIVSSLIAGGFVILTAILVLTIIFDNYFYKRFMSPLQVEINHFSKIVENEIQGDEDIERLSKQIDKVRALIDEKIAKLETEKNKLNYILEHMNQGLLIISGNKNVLLSNKYALNLLEYYNDDYVGKNYMYLLHNFNITDIVEKAFTQFINENKIVKQDEKYYSISIISLEGSFASFQDKNGVAIFILDVTSQKRIEKMKTDFFQNASHELKSPLTTILGYQQMIQAGILSDEDEIKKATDNTIQEAKRINNIVIEMLDLFKLETNPNASKEVINIGDTLNNLVTTFKPLIQEKEIKYHFDGESFDVLMNKEDLIRLLRNIIENAIKYNKKKSFITISLRDNKCIIKDGGIGIPKNAIDRIFERFYRIDKARSRDIGGTGLGLAIVKHICINYGIDIKVESEEGLGTTFILDFTDVISNK